MAMAIARRRHRHSFPTAAPKSSPRCHNFRITIATPQMSQLLRAYCFLARCMVLGFSLAEIYLGSWTAACGSPTASLLYERLRQRSRSPTWSTDLPWLLDCCRWQPHRVAPLATIAVAKFTRLPNFPHGDGRKRTGVGEASRREAIARINQIHLGFWTAAYGSLTAYSGLPCLLSNLGRQNKS